MREILPGDGTDADRGRTVHDVVGSSLGICRTAFGRPNRIEIGIQSCSGEVSDRSCINGSRCVGDVGKKIDVSGPSQFLLFGGE